MKNFMKRNFEVILILTVIGSFLFTSLTFKVASITTDLAIESFIRVRYNESEIKTDEMTEVYNESNNRSESMKNSTDIVESFVARTPFLARILFCCLFIYFEILIIRMYYEYIKLLIKRRQIMKKRLQKNSKRKPE